MEYKVLKINSDDRAFLEKKVNELALEGWKLESASHAYLYGKHVPSHYLYFSRKK